ncbi:MAG TPA: hypothetical protein VGL19_08895 [Polyangiaceae bacterium]|jgi:hypothetical protein
MRPLVVRRLEPLAETCKQANQQWAKDDIPMFVFSVVPELDVLVSQAELIKTDWFSHSMKAFDSRRRPNQP